MPNEKPEQNTEIPPRLPRLEKIEKFLDEKNWEKTAEAWVILEILATRSNVPKVQTFINENKSDLKEMYDYLFQNRPTGKPIITDSGDVIRTFPFTGSLAFSLLKMAKLLGQEMEDQEKKDLKELASNDPLLQTHFKTDLENL